MRSHRNEVLAVARRQDFVVSTAQARELTGDASWTERLVKNGAWQRPHHGVLVVHSGPTSWRTRARAALLYVGAGAALSHASAGFVHRLVQEVPGVIEVSIPEERRVHATRGVRILRRRSMPPSDGSLRTVNPADTVLDLVSAGVTDDAGVALLCSAIRAGTGADDLVAALGRRPWLPHRAALTELLMVVSEGVESPLERRYRRDVERAHGLPRARLQVRQLVGGRWIRADGLYEGLGVRVELDGELAHPGGRTDADVWRDNAVLIERRDLTLRYRWSHVRVNPCTTAVQVAAALRARGWSGAARRCSPACPLR